MSYPPRAEIVIRRRMAFCNVWFSKYSVQCISVIIAALGMISDGMQYGWPSPAIPRLLKNHSSIIVTKVESKWIVHSYIIGNIIGVLISISIFNKLSRKLSIFVASIPILFGWICNVLAPTLTVLCIARMVGGIGRNMAYVAVPMYIGEIADPKVRGVLGTFMYLSMNTGVLTVYSMTPYLPLFVPPVVGIVIVGVQMVLLKFVPESPYYLFLKQNANEARKSLRMLRKSNNVDEEAKEIAAEVERRTNGTRYGLKRQLIRLFAHRNNLKALGIILTLRSLQMLSGVSVMGFHIHTIFQQVNGSFTPETTAIIYSSILLILTLFSSTTIDRFGRRSLMIVSCSFTALILTLQGTYFYLQTKLDFDMSNVSWLPLLSVILFVLTYKIGLGTVPIVMVSEIFATDVKVAGIVLSDLMYSISSLTSNMIFDYTEDALGMYSPFWIFAGFCCLGILLSVLVVPETKGITLEEIQYILRNKDVPSNYAGSNQTLTTSM